MSERAEKYILGKVCRAYAFLLECSDKFATAERVILRDAPERLVLDPVFQASWRNYWAKRLRALFTGEFGSEFALILRMARHYIIVRQSADERGRTEYGVDALGPYMRFTPKRKALGSTREAVVSRISFEELCENAHDTTDAYWAVLQLINMTASDILGEKAAQ